MRGLILAAFLALPARAGGGVFVSITPKGVGTFAVEGRFATQASAEQVWEVLTDYEKLPVTKPPRAPPLPFGVEAREDSQMDPRGDDDRQDWPGSPGADQPA